MSKRVDFYLLKEQKPEARYHFACRLIEKAYKNGHQIFINTSTQHEANALDDLLWTFKDESFLPHCIAGEGAEAPIEIAFNSEPGESDDVLINLAENIPEFFKNFKRVIEIVPGDKEFKSKAREHYRYYKEQGCELNTHDY